MANLFVTEYVGARATPSLVDRESTLGAIKEAIDDRSRSYVLYITGLGGMGKTFLVRDVLRRCREGGEWFTPEARIMAAEAEVDLYHAHAHSLEGLMRAIWNVLGSARADLVGYERKMIRFEREKYDLAGMLRELTTLRDEVAQAFLDDLNRLAKTYRLVLALDTAEKLLYETDKIQETLGLGEEGIVVRPWLLREFLPKIENSVILIAGRPRPARLRQDLREALGDRLLELDLPGFESKDDAIAYFDVVAQAVRQEGKEEIADRIVAVPQDTREVIWRYTAGRPILLSLMVDYLVVANELLTAVKDPLETARGKSKAEIKEIEKKIEEELVRIFQNTGRAADEAIRILAWARKGIDAEMLARVAEMSVPEAEKTLDELRDLSFIKRRAADDRVFLHDEMYEMLERHVLSRLPKRRRDKVYQAILDYYKEEIAKARAQVAALQRPAGEKRLGEEDLVPTGSARPPAHAEALVQASSRLYSLMAEEVYYRLRRDPADGFKAHYVYRQEAFWINDESLDMQLRSEVLAYLAEREGVEQFDGLSRNDVELDAGLWWVDRIHGRTKYDRALDVAHGLREQCSELLMEGGGLAQAQLNASEGRALAYLGKDLDQAETFLRSSVDALRILKPDDDFEAWRRDASLADALNTLGYLYRTLGRYRQSIDAYQQALPLWRSLAEAEREKAETMRRAIEAQHANTLNNLSWALAEAGRFRQALLKCRDALEMRQRLGPRAPLAFSLNTMGLIQTRADQPHRASVNCENALAIFRDLDKPRGVALACIALAEALRRRSWASPELYPPERWAEFLRQAAERCLEAVDIFAGQVPERPRLVEALLEQGCTYRDWAAIRESYQGADPDSKTLARRAEDALRRAMREGEGEPGLFHKVIDAQVNLAWLYHYQGDDGRADQELKKVISRVPSEYLITPGQGLPERDLPQSFLWVQLGKSQSLYGQMAMKRFRDSKGSERLEHLEAAGYHYTLSLAYDELFAAEFRDMRRGMERIYDNMKKLNRQEFLDVCRGIDRAATEYNLPPPTRMHKFLTDSFGPINGQLEC
jgi:Tfp pilus assembly protein PilF